MAQEPERARESFDDYLELGAEHRASDAEYESTLDRLHEAEQRLLEVIDERPRSQRPTQS